jgi:para-aminobenzoate synthetase
MDTGPLRILVIDNYDSFTYNLVQCLAGLTGVDPTVLHNDDPWSAADLSDFDCVVISPGPGRPDRQEDFGICRAIIKTAQVPLLGVCLGHQGIGHAFGATIATAPEPMHGRTSLIRHAGDELFEGIPSPFRAVRYHSLMIDQVPDAIEVIARSGDGVPMAVRHRERPLWGVQFHPESICTEYGERLLANFLAAADARRDHHARIARRSPAARHTPDARRCSSGAPLPAQRQAVLVRRVACDADAESVYDSLFRESRHTFWLDSSLRGAGRFSFMGDAAGPLARTVAADVHDGAIIESGQGGRRVHRGSFFDWLRRDLEMHRTEVPQLPFGFALGWVGYLGYELKAETGGTHAHCSPYPDASMIFADRAVAFDHETGAVYLMALAQTGRERDAAAWLDRTERRLATVEPVSHPFTQARGPAGAMRLRHPRGVYLDKIAECQRRIRAGETYEVCLTNMVEVPAELEPWTAYRSLRAGNPVPYGALLRFGELAVLSCSPERFLSITSAGAAESRPIKGTRPRGQDARHDECLRAELAASEKDRAENLMIVDLVRNDLGVCARTGSVRVPRLFEVETYSAVHQLVSSIQADLRPGIHAVDCVRAAFPGGSMTGAPKIRTMRILDELECGPRGIYSGAIGYFSLNGAADLSIAIRTLVLEPGMVSYGTGGAITALSDPDSEFEETAVKAAVLQSVLDSDFPWLTLPLDAEEPRSEHEPRQYHRGDPGTDDADQGPVLTRRSGLNGFHERPAEEARGPKREHAEHQQVPCAADDPAAVVDDRGERGEDVEDREEQARHADHVAEGAPRRGGQKVNPGQRDEQQADEDARRDRGAEPAGDGGEEPRQGAVTRHPVDDARAQHDAGTRRRDH